MYSEADATGIGFGAPSLADEQRHEYKKLMTRALADV